MPGLKKIWISPRVAEVVRAVRTCPDSVLASSSLSEPSLVFLVGTQTKLVNPAAAADHLLADPRCALALIDTRDLPEFMARMADRSKTPTKVAEIDGVNYSTGRRLALGLYAAAENSASAKEDSPQ